MSKDVYNILKDLLPERVRETVEPLSSDELKSLTLGELGITSMENVEFVVKIEELYRMEFGESELLQIGFLRFEEIASLISAYATQP